MSSAQYANVELEENVVETQASVQKLRPFVVRGRRDGDNGQPGRRIIEVIDSQLERGSMPA